MRQWAPYVSLVADVPELYQKFGFKLVRPESEGMALVGDRKSAEGMHRFPDALFSASSSRWRSAMGKNNLWGWGEPACLTKGRQGRYKLFTVYYFRRDSFTVVFFVNGIQFSIFKIGDNPFI
ncbi:Uncharacterised protein [Raoultella terrigena]|uniref:Uncharacterized protein n=1 Tax=Raoultella terrigena TaxID=577 RepID=A0A4U9D1I2_RAOTE|nr:Uncharacterised protein [Raoultella terrigena]